ncbi:MAG: hypothetical protein ABIM29_07055 [candidate division WOR-3 bacterium]
MKILILFLSFYLIKGNVINQTFKKNQGNVKIFIFNISQERLTPVDSLFSKNGEFKFDLKEGVYLVKVFYKDVIFRNIISINKDTSLNFNIWETKSDEKIVKISRVHMAILKENNKISVIEVITFKNDENYAFFKPFEINLPEGIENFLPFTGLFPNEVIILKNKLLYHFPISPPEEILSFEYYIKGDLEYQRVLPFKIDLFEIFLSENLKIEGIKDGENYETAGKKYLRFKLKEIKENEMIYFKVKIKRGNYLKDIVPVLIVIIFIGIFLIFKWKRR